MDKLFTDQKLLNTWPALISRPGDYANKPGIVEVAERPKFRKYFDLLDLTDLLVSLKQKAELVKVSSQVNICRDDKDNFLLSRAIDGTATHLLTGDKDLLVLHPFGNVQILTIAGYLSDK